MAESASGGQGVKNWHERLAELVGRWPRHCALVDNVVYRRKEASNRVKAFRRTVVISVAGLQTTAFKTDLLAMFDPDSISFPAWEKATHLFVRVQDSIYDNGFYVLPGLFRFGDIPLSLYRFKKLSYRLPHSRRLEPVLQLQPKEAARLQIYLSHIKKNRKQTLGRYHHDGDQQTRGRLDDNRALEKGHNCASWLTTAPIGEDGAQLLELIGSQRQEPVGTNPGWWYRTLLSQAADDRLPAVLYWTPSPLATALATEVRSYEPIAWDFLAR